MNHSRKNAFPICFYRLAVSALLLFLLAGCAQTMSQVVPKMVRSITPENVKVLEEGDGYLLMAFTTNRPLRRLHIDGPMDVVLTQDDLQKGTNYILITLPEGQYRISKVMGHFSKFSFDADDYWDFSVQRDTVSYIGDLNTHFWGFYGMARARYELVNRSSKALEFLESTYPSLIKEKTAVYSGFGKDRFLEFMTKTTQTSDKDATQDAQGSNTL